MTNKRITELTALDGDDVADNDVLAIVDVSDTTMAASGTTKKITVAELVTDSALTNKFWPNSTTALTGANLANGDKLAVVDVGSPDVAKYITADELAQGSQFSGRYKPLASDRLSFSPSQFIPILNTPAQGTLGNASSTLNRVGALLYDDTADESAASAFVWPVGWASCKAYIWFSPASAGSGDVRWEIRLLSLSDAGSSDANGNAETITATAPAQYTVKRSGGGTTYTGTAGQFTRLTIRRYGSNAADTLTGDAGMILVELVRES